MHFLIAFPPAAGHSTPVLRIAQALAQREHSVTLFTTKGWVDSPEGAQGRMARLVKGMSMCTVEGEASLEESFERLKAQDGVSLPISVFEKLLAQVEHACRKPLTELHERQPIDFALLDFFVHGAGIMKTLASLDIDFAVNLPGPQSMLWLLRHEGTEDWSCLPWSLRFQFFFMRKLMVDPFVTRHTALSAFRPFLVNSFPELEAGTVMPEYCEFTGSLAKPLVKCEPLEGDLAEFIKRASADGLPVVCVSLGSHVKPDKVIVDALYEALADGPWRVVWSLRGWALKQIPADVDRSKFYISSWIPQQEVLAQPECKVFLTHGGWGGLMEGACAGVPVLVLPFFGDQQVNATLAKQSGWGLDLPDQNVLPPQFGLGDEPPKYTGNLTASVVREKLQQILSDSSFSAQAKIFQEASK
eukprot:TRINITY_DN5520_c0_g1_i1.p1 TRINITY_DN5520_c0_g1~~TRINITY_DN5520_c0_g1_i1.p1  ORF type:complete len:440 (+),score=73.73 TRINITY_DN5520_c0_g1_i1:78-1322(+)